MIRALLLWVLLLVAAPVAARGVDTDGSFVDLPKVKSANIRPMHVTIWLPPGYGRGHQRYPVIYM